MSFAKYLEDKPDFELSEASIQVMPGFIDFNYPTRPDVELLLKHLQAGRWIKEKSGNDKLNYITEHPMVAGLKIRLWTADPPGTCRMVEERVFIPAQPERIEIRQVLHCEPLVEDATAGEVANV